MSKVFSALEHIELNELPEGEYDGLWSGYSVNATIENRKIEFQVKDGLRGINIPCIVTILNGSATVQLKDRKS